MMKDLPPILATDVLRLLQQEMGVALFLLDERFQVLWGNTTNDCLLQHVPHAPGVYHYRTVQDADGRCHQTCPYSPDQTEGRDCYRELADDTESVYQVTVTLRRDAGGRPCGYLAVQQDVTRWKKADDRWCQDASREYLYHLAGGIAHEINNPLTVLHGLLQEYACDAELRSEQRQDFQTMSRACDRIREFVRRLLAFSAEEPEAGPAGNLEGILSRTVSFFQEFFRIKGIRIEWELPARWPPMAMKPGVFAKVAFNLVHYIADSIRPGGVIRVQIPEGGDANYFRMVFASDDFVAVPTRLNDLFLPFGGNGEVGAIHSLGLATVHDLVKTSQGHMRMERTAPHALAFHLEIPLFDTGSAAAPRPDPALVVSGSE
jgi:two-component system cell cycle sensor histidine kinase/response regulator CckA